MMCCAIRQQHNCCCSLRTGTLVASSIICIVTVAFLFAFLPVINIIFSSVNVFVTEHPEAVLKQFQAHMAQVDSDTLVPRLGYSVLHIIVVIILAVGVSKQNNKLFLPWLILIGIQGLAGLAATIAIPIFIFVFFVNRIAILIFTIIFFLVLLITTIWWYFFLCVCSYYLELEDEKKEKKITKRSSPRQSAV